MSRTVNIPKRAETLLDKAFMHHSIAMRSLTRHAARPDTKSGMLEMERVQKHEQKLADVIQDLKRLVSKV